MSTFMNSNPQRQTFSEEYARLCRYGQLLAVIRDGFFIGWAYVSKGEHDSLEMRFHPHGGWRRSSTLTKVGFSWTKRIWGARTMSGAEYSFVPQSSPLASGLAEVFGADLAQVGWG